MPSLLSGVYVIANLVNGKVYVGSSIDLRRREAEHFRRLISGNHPIPYLQNSWNKYGSENFVFVVVEHCLPEQLLPREQWWIDKLKSYEFANGYNRSPTAGSSLGCKLSEKTRVRMSCSKLGISMPEPVKEKIRRSLTGKPKSADHRANLWKNRQGWRHTEATKKKISEGLIKSQSEGKKIGWPKGLRHTTESRQRMSLSGRGKPKSLEHRLKISAALKAAKSKSRLGND